MATTEQLTIWLGEAEAARHALALGGAAISVSTSSGRSVTYSAAKLGELDAYIASLKRQVGLPSSARPLRFQVGGR